MASKRNRNANGKPTQSPAVDVCHENDAVVVRIPVRFYRRNGRQMVLAQNDAIGNEQPVPNPNQTLIANLAKAYQWQEQLESGEFASFDELGKAVGVDRTYVSRILQLTSLSPKVVERILNGDEPSGLNMESLRKSVPEVWSQQLFACQSYTFK